MKKGFTLIEILFVLLVIALILSFALPAYRSVRFDMKNLRAQASLKKLAEARRTFYQTTKGMDITVGSFLGKNAQSYSASECSATLKDGIPKNEAATAFVSQLFACGFLDWKDFADLPYKFHICNINSKNANEKPCMFLPDDTQGNEDGRIYAAAQGVSAAEAGEKYSPDGDGAYYMYVGADMQVRNNLE